MKPGDLTRFISDGESGVFYLGIHGGGGVSVPSDSIGMILEVYKTNKRRQGSVDVLVNRTVGWCFIEDIEVLRND